MADHKSRSRSPAPAARSENPRRRSRSPRRRDDDSHHDRPRGNKSGGLKWKEKSAQDDRNGGEKRLERGYRNRSRSPRREKQQESKGTSVEDKFGTSDKFKMADKFSVADKLGTADKFGEDKSKTGGKKDDREPPKRAAAPAPVTGNEPMIIVYVNDRLGTRAAIPCLASDNIKLFKAQVAARIGRKPHEILLKRQGERPFKDQLTLEDYGVSNGVQIDLEIDTGE